MTAGNTAASLGADLSWAGIKIASPGGLVTINSGNALTMGTSGIDPSTATQDLTLNSGLTLRNNGQQSWTAAAGRTLNVAGTFAHTGAVVSFTSFNAAATLSGLANDASGILGPWATTGSGTSMNYVASTAGAISAYTGQTAATPADMSDVIDENVNYSLAKPAGGTTLVSPITANTLRVTSTSDNAIANAGNSITLNGLMGVETNRMIISGTGDLVIGATNELVVNWTVGFSSVICRVVDNSGGSSSLVINRSANAEDTFGVSGLTSTYTGGTTINYPAAAN